MLMCWDVIAYTLNSAIVHSDLLDCVGESSYVLEQRFGREQGPEAVWSVAMHGQNP
jgi:hypothetical protein